MNWLLRRNCLYKLLILTPFLQNRMLFYLREACHRARLKHRGRGGYLQDALITTPQNVSIGDRVTCGGRVFMDGLGGLTVGDDCMIAYGSILTTASHDPAGEIMNKTMKTAPITLGKNVWIGASAIVLPGVTIADGVVVGAGAVVTRSVMQPDVIVAGSPAKVIRSRKDAKAETAK